jgi:hypothetical protein
MACFFQRRHPSIAPRAPRAIPPQGSSTMPLIHRLQCQGALRTARGALYRALLRTLLPVWLLLQCSPPAVAAEYEVIGAYGQIQTAIATHDHYAYVAGGCNLRVLDIADPEQPQSVGYLRLKHKITQMLVAWPALFVAQLNGEGVEVVNIANPDRPHVQNTLSDDAQFAHLKIAGHFLIIESGSKSSASRISIYNILSLRHPQLVFSQPMPYDDLRFALMASEFQLFIAKRDINDGTHRLEDCTTSPSRQLAQHAYANGDDILKDLKYEPSTGKLTWGSGSAAQHLGDFPGGYYFAAGQSICDSSTTNTATLPVPGWTANPAFQQVKVADRIAYAVRDAELALIDCRMPKNPTLITSVMLSAPISAFSVEDRALYVAIASGQLEILDLKDRSSPLRVNTVPVAAPAVSMASSAKRLYVLSESAGLQIFDLPAWNQPQLAGTFKPQQAAFDLVTSGSLVYLLGQDALTIVETRDPQHPRQISQLALQWPEPLASGKTPRLKKAGAMLYALCESADENECYTLGNIINAADSVHPQSVAVIDRSTYQANATLQTMKDHSEQNFMLALPHSWQNTFASGQEYCIFDLSNPARPVPVKSIESMNPGQPVIGRETLYLPTGEGLLVLRRRE